MCTMLSKMMLPAGPGLITSTVQGKGMNRTCEVATAKNPCTWCCSVHPSDMCGTCRIFPSACLHQVARLKPCGSHLNRHAYDILDQLMTKSVSMRSTAY